MTDDIIKAELEAAAAARVKHREQLAAEAEAQEEAAHLEKLEAMLHNLHMEETEESGPKAEALRAYVQKLKGLA